MNYPRIFLAIFLMALITYLLRMLPMALIQKKIQNRFILSFLAYVPYAVLAAMTVPDIFSSTSSVISALCGLVAAVALAIKGRGLLTVALVAAGVVFIVERLLPLLPL